MSDPKIYLKIDQGILKWRTKLATILFIFKMDILAAKVLDSCMKRTSTNSYQNNEEQKKPK